MRPLARLLAGLAAVLSLGGTARADAVSEGPDSVSLTAYREARGWNSDDYFEDWYDGLDEHDGLVMVTETRMIDVPAGRAKISFRGVAEGIVPQTAAVEGLPAAMLERNQDYDLLSPASLIDKSIGKRVRLVRTNRFNGEVTEEAATVRSGPSGTVLDYGDGRVEALKCSGWPERLVFEEAPAGLTDTPTLSVVTNSPQAGRHQVRISYLAFGLKWAADYVAKVASDGKTLELTGWITLVNRSSTTFRNAPTQVVAGRVEWEDETELPQVRRLSRANACWPLDTTTRVKPPPPPPPMRAYDGGESYDGVEALIVTAQRREESIQDVPIALMARESDLADYKLYTLPEPTSVAAHQSKQVMMLSLPAVKFRRLYVRQLNRSAESEENKAEQGYGEPFGVIRIDNKAAQGLGRALPGGGVAVMEPYGPDMLLSGKGRIDDAPVGLPIDIMVGRAWDLRVMPRQVREWAVETPDGEDRIRREWEVILVNGKPTAETLELRLYSDELKVISASKRPGRRYADLTWTFKLKPGERKVLRYVAETGW